MFLKLHPVDNGCLVEVLDLRQLFDPFASEVTARLHGGEELQDPQPFAKAELCFPSGEPLPRCWREAQYRALR